MTQERGHLKPCDNGECKYRLSSRGVCAYGGWNSGHGCYVEWMEARSKKNEEEDKLRPTIKILDIGYRATKHSDKDVEIKKIEHAEKYSSEFGRATLKFSCPFCNNPIIAYIWSFAAIGKRCDNCGAICMGGYWWEARRKKV